MQRIKALIVAALVWTLLGAPAFAAGYTQIVGTATGGGIVTATFNSGATATATVNVNVPAGAIVFPLGLQGATGTATNVTCADSVGNTYLYGQPGAFQNGVGVRIAYSVITTPLVAGSSTLSCTTTTVNGITIFAAAFNNPAPSPYDSASAAAQIGNTTGAPTITTGTLNGPCVATTNCGLVIGIMIRHTAATLTNDTAFTNLIANSSTVYAVGFKIVSATTPVAWAPSFSSGSNWALMLQAFKAAGTNPITGKLFGPVP